MLSDAKMFDFEKRKQLKIPQPCPKVKISNNSPDLCPPSKKTPLLEKPFPHSDEFLHIFLSSINYEQSHSFPEILCGDECSDAMISKLLRLWNTVIVKWKLISKKNWLVIKSISSFNFLTTHSLCCSEWVERVHLLIVLINGRQKNVHFLIGGKNAKDSETFLPRSKRKLARRNEISHIEMQRKEN